MGSENNNLTHNMILENLTFGFWVGLFHGFYNRQVWEKHKMIECIFPYIHAQERGLDVIQKDINGNDEPILVEDALHFWYATYYSKPHSATSRRINIVTQFHKAFVEESDSKESYDLRNAVNRENNQLLKEVFSACKIYLQIQKQQEHIKIPKYMFEMLGFVISQTIKIDNIVNSKISENIITDAKEKVDSILHRKTDKAKTNFIRTEPAFNNICKALNPLQ